MFNMERFILYNMERFILYNILGKYFIQKSSII